MSHMFPQTSVTGRVGSCCRTSGARSANPTRKSLNKVVMALVTLASGSVGIPVRIYYIHSHVNRQKHSFKIEA